MSLSGSRRQMSVALLAGVERQGHGSVGGGGSEVGVQGSLPLGASTSCRAHPFSVLQPHFHQGQSLGEGGSVSCRERSCRACSFTFSGFYSRIFVVMKALGSWRPVIDLSTLNLRVRKTPFKMDTLQSVLLSVRSGDWMVSIDLKDAYLQVLSCDVQPVSLWRKLLGVLSSLTAIVPGGRLRMRSLQLHLHCLWDQEDDSTLIPWDQDCRLDLEWWIVPGHLQSGISLAQVNLHLDFWSDASDVGWGAHLLDATTSGRWSQEEAQLSINARELLAVEYGLRQFHLLVSISTVAVFADNSTALAYLHKQWGTRSPVLNSIAQRILRWAESIDLVLVPQFIQGRHNVLADSLSRPNQVQGSEWTLKWEVFRELNNKWPVMINLFATSLNHRCSLYFSPFRDPLAIGTDALLQTWDGYQVYAFPPWSMIPLVLKKL